MTLPYGFDDPESRAMIERTRARYRKCDACGHDRLPDADCANCAVEARESERRLNRTAPARDRNGRRIG